MSRERTLRCAAIALIATASALVVALVVVELRYRSAVGGASPNGPTNELVIGILGFVILAAAAAIAMWRVPRNATGWVLAVWALLSAADGFTSVYGAIAVEGRMAAPGGLVAAGLNDWMFFLELGAVGLLVAIVPTGRPLSRRWRVVAVASVVLTLVTYALKTVTFHDDSPGGLFDQHGQNDPLILFGKHSWAPTPGRALIIITILLMLGSLPALILRIRRADRQHRLQLAWPATVLLFGVSTAGLAVLVHAPYPGLGSLLGTVADLVLSTLVGPAVVIALLRYRLYDVERLAVATIVWFCLSVLMIGVYTLTSIAVGAAVTQGRSSPWVVGAATLAAAASIAPARRLLQRRVDHRFRRRVGDAVHSVEQFTATIGQKPVDVRQLRDVLAAAADDPTLQIYLWRMSISDYVGVDGTAMPTGAGHDRHVIDRDGAPFAAIVHDSDSTDPQRLAAVATAARPALELARLQAEVDTQLSEIRNSRHRIITAADDERRRIERDLHDGAQQRLVALALSLRRAQRDHGDDPEIVAVLRQTIDELSGAVRELRDLASGIHPAALSDGGLAAAIESLARRTPLDVNLSIPEVRYRPDTETAVYFVACEALANAVKHANPTKVGINVSERDGRVLIVIDDNGCGGAQLHCGTGLRGLADRVESLGGALSVISPPAGGTTVRAEVPC